MTIEGTYNELLSVDQDIQRWIIISIILLVQSTKNKNFLLAKCNAVEHRKRKIAKAC
jgi:hypothetical protein